MTKTERVVRTTMKLFYIILTFLSFFQRSTTTKLNVLLIMVDDLRATTKKEVNLTHIQRLARTSVTFTHAFAQVSLPKIG